MELPSNIFCQFPYCNSRFIVHHHALDILEAHNPSPYHKKGNKRNDTVTNNNTTNDDHSHLISSNPFANYFNTSSSEETPAETTTTETTITSDTADNNNHTKLRKRNYNNKIMVEPVVLSCDHGYCFECLSQVSDMICCVCGKPFTMREVKVNRFVEQICEWFGEHRTFISLLLGTDIYEPPSSPSPSPSTLPSPLHIPRSASSDLFFPHSLPSLDNPLDPGHPRWSSTDNLVALDENVASSSVNARNTLSTSEEKKVRRERHLSHSGTLQRSTRNVSPPRGELKAKGEKAEKSEKGEGKGKAEDDSDATRLAKLGVSLTARPSDSSGTESTSSRHKSHRFSLLPGASFIKKIVSPRKDTPVLHREPTVDLSKFKTESRQQMEKIMTKKKEHDLSSESGTESEGNMFGLHKRNVSAPETIKKNATLLQKNKSRSFGVGNEGTQKEKDTHNKSSSTNSITKRSLNAAFANIPPPITDSDLPSSSSNPLRASGTYSVPSSPALTVTTPGGTRRRPSRSFISFSRSDAGPSTKGKSGMRPSRSFESYSEHASASDSNSNSASLNVSQPIPRASPSSFDGRNNTNTSNANTTNTTAKDNSSNINNTANVNNISNTNNISINTTNNTPQNSAMSSMHIRTIPNTAVGPIRFALPSNKPAHLSRIFSLSKYTIEGANPHRGAFQSPEPAGRKLASMFAPPTNVPAVSVVDSLDELENIALYLPTEVLEFGVLVAEKDKPIAARSSANTNQALPPLKPRRPVNKRAGTNIKTLGWSMRRKKAEQTKRLSLPNLTEIAATVVAPIGLKKAASDEGFKTKKRGNSSGERPESPPPEPTEPSSSSPPSAPSSRPTSPNRLGAALGHNKPTKLSFLSKFKLLSSSTMDFGREHNGPTAGDSYSQSSVEVSKLMKFLGMEMSVELQWTTKNLENYRNYAWSNATGPHENQPPIVIQPGWHVEYRETVPLGKVIFEIEDRQKDTCWYTDHFFCKSHATYVGGDNQHPLFVAVETEPSPPYKVLVRTKFDDDRLWVLDYSRKQLVKVLKAENENLRFVKDFSVQQQMTQWDYKEVCRCYKFGILYAKSGQSSETEFFSNTSGATSLAYEKFLDSLGEKVVLQGWTKFSAGLDVERNYDGTHSIFTKFKQFDVMFHVSTMLAHVNNDPQQLEKKKHIGNDIVVVVFMEEGTPPLDPNFMRTQFTHVYIVVQPVTGSPTPTNPAGIKYRIAVTAKQGVRPFGPNIPESFDFEPGPLLRHFLMLKLINAERASLCAPVFRDRLVAARRTFLSSLLAQASK